MLQNNPVSVREMLAQMPIDQLEAMLDLELHKESVDAESVRMILSVLRERDQKSAEQITPEMLEVWEHYQDASDEIWDTEQKWKRIRSSAVRILSTAAVLVLILLTIPQKASADSIWRMLVDFKEDIMEFFSPADITEHSLEYVFKTNHPGLQQVYDAVVEMGVDIPVVPMWIPEKYVLNDCKTLITPAKSGLNATFGWDDLECVFNIDVYQNPISRSYQKNDIEIREVELNGKCFYITRNLDVLVAVWTEDNIECSIFIECQEDTLEKILKSIYEMEDEK